MTDTNKVLQELRDLFNMKVPHQPMHRMRIAELFDRLDRALSNGERLPDDWADAIRPQVGRGQHLCPVCCNAHSLPLCNDVSTMEAREV